MLAPTLPPGPFDQRDDRGPRRTCCPTPAHPLQQPCTVLGAVSVTLFAASSAPDTDFVARLVDVHPDGRAFNVVDGIIRAGTRDTYPEPGVVRPRAPSPLRPGRALPVLHRPLGHRDHVPAGPPHPGRRHLQLAPPLDPPHQHLRRPDRRHGSGHRPATGLPRHATPEQAPPVRRVSRRTHEEGTWTAASSNRKTRTNRTCRRRRATRRSRPRSAARSSTTTSSSTAPQPRWSSRRSSSRREPGRGDDRVAGHLRRGVRRPAGRLVHLRPSRRHDRPQEGPGHHVVRDGGGDVPHRRDAHLRPDRLRRADPAADPAPLPGPGRVRRAVQREFDVTGARPGEPARVLHQLHPAPERRAATSSPAPPSCRSRRCPSQRCCRGAGASRSCSAPWSCWSAG